MNKFFKIVLIIFAVVFIGRFMGLHRFFGRAIRSAAQYVLVGNTYKSRLSLRVFKKDCDSGTWSNLVALRDKYISLYSANDFDAFSMHGDVFSKALTDAQEVNNCVSMRIEKRISSSEMLDVEWRNKMTSGEFDIAVWGDVARSAERYVKLYKVLEDRSDGRSSRIRRLEQAADVLIEALDRARAAKKMEADDSELTVIKSEDSGLSGGNESFNLVFLIEKGPKCDTATWNRIARISKEDDFIRGVCKIVSLVGLREELARHSLGVGAEE